MIPADLVTYPFLGGMDIGRNSRRRCGALNLEDGFEQDGDGRIGDDVGDAAAVFLGVFFVFLHPVSQQHPMGNGGFSKAAEVDDEGETPPSGKDVGNICQDFDDFPIFEFAVQDDARNWPIGIVDMPLAHAVFSLHKFDGDQVRSLMGYRRKPKPSLRAIPAGLPAYFRGVWMTRGRKLRSKIGLLVELVWSVQNAINANGYSPTILTPHVNTTLGALLGRRLRLRLQSLRRAVDDEESKRAVCPYRRTYVLPVSRFRDDAVRCCIYLVK